MTSRRRPGSALAVALLSITTVTLPATADPPDSGALRLPIAEAQRPITIPQLILEPTLQFEGARFTRTDITGFYYNLGLSAGFGITDDLTVRALVLPLQLGGPSGSGGFHYGQATEDRGPSVGATYRLVRGALELGLLLDLRALTVQDDSGVAIIPGATMRVHAGDHARIDLAPSVNVTLQRETGTPPPGSATTETGNLVRIDVPFTALVNLLENVDVGITTGATIEDVSQAKASTSVPLGFFAGCTIPGRHGPLFEFTPYLTFPFLFMPAATSRTNTNEYLLGVTFTGFLYF
jgi:hypothetical protein